VTTPAVSSLAAHYDHDDHDARRMRRGPCGDRRAGGHAQRAMPEAPGLTSNAASEFRFRLLALARSRCPRRARGATRPGPGPARAPRAGPCPGWGARPNWQRYWRSPSQAR
jgi:hypothetical protein